MMRLINEYPIIKWVLIVCAILYFLEKYLKIKPLDRFMNLFFDDIGDDLAVDLNDIHLKKMVQLFNQRKFEQVTEIFQNFTPSYRSYGIEVLGAKGSVNISNEWISKEPNSALPKIIKGSQLISEGWEIRGNGTINTVSDSSLKAFKSRLKAAEEVLLEAKKHESVYKVNANSFLLKLYKASNVDRAIIHQTFAESEGEHKNHAGLNFNYFSAISYKWGGTEEEVNNYFQSLGGRSEFISNLTMSLYYLDSVAMYKQKDTDGKIKQFLEKAKNFSIESKELYCSEFYRNAYFLTHNLGYKELKKHYITLAKPFFKHEED